MDTLEKIVVGLILFAVTSALGFLFKLRQLYVVVPKLYRHSTVADKGSLCEVIIYNRGKQVEEDIHIQIDPDLKCELLATSSTGITLTGSLIKLDRLHKASDVSAILLVENGLMDVAKLLSISSKACNGKKINKISEVPVNGANTLLFVIGFIAFGFAIGLGPKAFEYFDQKLANYKLTEISESGWSGLNNYYHSSMSNSYSDGEFPVRFVEIKNTKEGVSLIYEVYNKTALPLTVYTDQKSKAIIEKGIEPSPGKSFSSVDVPALEKKQFTARALEKNDSSGEIYIGFSFRNGKEFLYKINHRVVLEK